MTFKRFKRRAPLVLLSPALWASFVLLTGCVSVDVNEKTTPIGATKPLTMNNPTSINRAATYEEAMDHLQATRQAFLNRARAFEAVDAGTRLGVGMGVVGAGVSATLENHAAKKAGKWLTFGAANYVVNRSLAPVAVSRVYRAGMTNLECIRGAAIVAETDAKQIKDELNESPDPTNRLKVAIGELQTVVDEIHTAKPAAGEEFAPLLASTGNATSALKDARKVLRGAEIFKKNDGGVGERVLSAVNGTRAVVNDLALQRTPNVEAILQSGAAFARFTGTGATFVGDIKAAQDKLKAALENGQSESGDEKNKRVDAWIVRLEAKESQLRDALTAMPDMSLADDFSAIAQCKTAVGVYKPVSVSPNPIKATVGGDAVKLTLSGTSPFTGLDLPHDVSFDGTGKSPVLKAGDKAEVGDHIIRFTDALGVDSDGVTLTLEAKKPASANGAENDEGGATTTTNKPPSAPVTNGPAPTPPEREAKPNETDKDKAGDKKATGVK